MQTAAAAAAGTPISQYRRFTSSRPIRSTSAPHKAVPVAPAAAAAPHEVEKAAKKEKVHDSVAAEIVPVVAAAHPVEPSAHPQECHKDGNLDIDIEPFTETWWLFLSLALICIFFAALAAGLTMVRWSEQTSEFASVYTFRF